MTIYLLNYFLLILYMIFFFQIKNQKIKSVLFIVAVIQLILLQGLRSPYLGNDMPFYWFYYNKQLPYSITNLSFSNFEILFKVLTKVISSITLDKHIYLVIISFLSTVPISIVIYKKSKNPILSLLLFLSFGFYNFNFSGLRQAIAFAIVFYSFLFIIDRKLIKFIISIVIASLFHSSALVFIPAYFLFDFKITKFKIILMIFIDVFIYIFKVPIFGFINSFFYEEYGMVLSDSYLWMIMCLSILMICLLFYKKISSDNKSILYNLVIIGTAIMLLSPIANNILRVANYYFMFIILLIPEVISYIKSNKNGLLVNLMTIIFSISLYIYLLLVDSYSIVPYIFGN